MGRLMAEGLVQRHGLSRIEIRERKRILKVQIRGRVECTRDVLVIVDKWLEARYNRRGQCEVRGFSYSYQACLRDEKQLLRYDSAHGLGELHRHEYDLVTGEESDLRLIALDDLPPLDEVIREALEKAP